MEDSTAMPPGASDTSSLEETDSTAENSEAFFEAFLEAENFEGFLVAENFKEFLLEGKPFKRDSPLLPRLQELLQVFHDPNYSFESEREHEIYGSTNKWTFLVWFMDRLYQNHTIMTPFRQTIQEVFINILEAVVPFCHKSNPQYDRFRFQAKDLVTEKYPYIFYSLTIFREKSWLYERWKRGMLREGVIRLINLTLEGMAERLQSDLARGLTPEKAEEISEFIFGPRVVYFFANPRFRSQRMEDTILRYIDEDDHVNVELVEGIEEKTLAFKEAEEKAWDESLNSHLSKDELWALQRQLERGPDELHFEPCDDWSCGQAICRIETR